ncbi:hypothetical protein OG946_24755 [Streptomyces sp. NBC_01808]|uniref:hypothetical protein n=1 Tax=Streptomyces sp. NBC_01808 TaxID=2975947 RepID=UPI002DDBDE99|nr:hypothetical protein [Streptomyces sp. NBC_01808]WSA40293.1 hypothetical protein OG946_24755 [Streptomyces sp. NBC_01808]
MDHLTTKANLLWWDDRQVRDYVRAQLAGAAAPVRRAQDRLSQRLTQIDRERPAAHRTQERAEYDSQHAQSLRQDLDAVRDTGLAYGRTWEKKSQEWRSTPRMMDVFNEEARGFNRAQTAVVEKG